MNYVWLARSYEFTAFRNQHICQKNNIHQAIMILLSSDLWNGWYLVHYLFRIVRYSFPAKKKFTEQFTQQKNSIGIKNVSPCSAKAGLKPEMALRSSKIVAKAILIRAAVHMEWKINFLLALFSFWQHPEVVLCPQRGCFQTIGACGTIVAYKQSKRFNFTLAAFWRSNQVITFLLTSWNCLWVSLAVVDLANALPHKSPPPALAPHPVCCPHPTTSIHKFSLLERYACTGWWRAKHCSPLAMLPTSALPPPLHRCSA